MPAANVAADFVCFRCRLWAAQTLRHSKHRPTPISSIRSQKGQRNGAAERLYHATTTSPTQTSPNENSIKTSANGGGSLRTKGWRALLENKALGEDTSVLVLRDSERNRSGIDQFEHEQADQGIESQSMNAADILSSIEKHGATPTDAEAAAGIESLRPRPSARDAGGQVQIPAADFEQIASQLAQGFTFPQLARYWVDREPSKDHKLIPSLVKKKQGADALIDRSPWAESDSSKGTKKNKRDKRVAGQRRLITARRIMAVIWNIDIIEDVGPEGSTRLFAPMEKVQPLLVGEKPILTDIAAMYDVKITVERGKQSQIRVMATRNKCERAADHIHALLRSSYTAKLSLDALSAHLIPELKPVVKSFGGYPSLLEKIMHTISSSTHCYCSIEKLTSDKREFHIHGTSVTDVEQCQRLLVASLTADYQLEQQTVKSSAADTLNLMAVNSSPRAVRPPWRDHQHGRLVSTNNVLAQSSPDRQDDQQKTQLLEEALNTGYPVTSKTVKSLSGAFAGSLRGLSAKQESEQGLESEQLAPAVEDDPQKNFVGFSAKKEDCEIVYSAESGRVLFPHTGDPVQLQVPASDPFQTEKLKSDEQKSILRSVPTFVPSLSGLSNLLSTNFRTDSGHNEASLHVRLIPSPRAGYGLQNRQPHQVLELSLGFDPQSRDIWVQSLSAKLQTKQRAILMPSMSEDVMFSKNVYAPFLNVHLHGGITRFIRHVQDSAVGFGRISTPLLLNLPPPPSWGLREGKASEPKDVEFMSMGVEYRETLKFDYQGCELVYKRVEAGEMGASTESLVLVSRAPIRGPTEDKENVKALIDKYGSLMAMVAQGRTAKAGAEALKETS